MQAYIYLFIYRNTYTLTISIISATKGEMTEGRDSDGIKKIRRFSKSRTVPAQRTYHEIPRSVPQHRREDDFRCREEGNLDKLLCSS